MQKIDLGFLGASLAIEPASANRIYAPIAYPVVREAQVVPVVHLEAMSLATWFPVVWLQAEGGHQLVVVRSLLAKGQGHPAGTPRHPRSLPVILRAYPFSFDVGAEAGALVSLGISDATPDQPTDVGAPILLASGQPSRGTEQRCRALALFARVLPETRAMTEFLVEHDLMAPWPLKLTIEGVPVDISDLAVVRSDLFDTGAFADFVHRFGARGARFLAAHRLSLFRAV